MSELNEFETVGTDGKSIHQYLVDELAEKKRQIEIYQKPRSLTKPARVGGTVFREGVSERLVIEAAQRHYEYVLKNPRKAPYTIDELNALVRAEQ